MGTPYTDADLDLVAEGIAREWGYDSLAEVDSVPDTEGTQARASARAALDALAAAGRLAPADDDPRHIIELRTDGWTIKHPLACRPQLFDCPVNRAAERDLDGPPPAALVGRYECGLNDLGDRFLLGDRVDQAEGSDHG